MNIRESSLGGVPGFRRFGLTGAADEGVWTSSRTDGIGEPKVRYTEAQKEPILRAYQERVSLRGRPRRFGVSIGTVLNWRGRSWEGLGLGMLAAGLWGLGFSQGVPDTIRPVLAFLGSLTWMWAVDWIPSCRIGWIDGWLAGFLFHVIVFSWLPLPLHTFAVSPLSLGRAWLVTICLALYMGFYWALWLGGIVHLRRCLRWRLSWLWFGAALWVGLMHIRSRLFTGLPWGQVETLLTSWPTLVQWADILGSLSVSGWLLLVGGHGIRWWRKRTLRNGLSLLVLFSPVFYGFLVERKLYRYTYNISSISFRMIQPSIPQDIKLSVDPMVWFKTQIDMSRLPRPAMVDLIIWPESSVPYGLMSPPIQSIIRDLNEKNQAYLLVGADREALSFPRVVYNSAFLLDPNGFVIDFHDKVRPIPLGEYLPLASYPRLRKILTWVAGFQQSLTGDITPAQDLRPMRSPWGVIGVLICSESIFPDLSRRLVREGAQLLIILSNNAWLGFSSGALQHFLHTRFRAIETRRSVLMVSNSGISVLIEPSGHIRWRTRLFEKTWRDDRVWLLNQPMTPWVRWGHVITLFWVGFGLLGLGITFWPPLQNSTRGSPHR